MMKRIPTISLALVVSLVIISVTLAQTGGGYDLTWNSIDGGYMFSTGGGYNRRWNHRPARCRGVEWWRLHTRWRILGRDRHSIQGLSAHSA